MNYKIGDIVIICHVPGQTDILPWEPRMDSCCGLEGTVVSIDYINSDKIYAVKSIDRLGKENTFWYQGNWLMREDNSYWGKFTSYEAYRKAGLNELDRQQKALNDKRDAILRKLFSRD